MRILFFSHYFPPEVNAPANRTYANCRLWAKSGHQVTVITCVPNCPSGKVYPGYRNRRIQREKMDEIEVVRVWTILAPNRGTLKRSISYFSFLISAFLHSLGLQRPDLVVATSPQFFCGWAGILAARWLGVPVVLEIRDIWPDSIAAVKASTNRLLMKSLAFLEKAMYGAADRIVTVGDGYRDVLLTKGVPPGKISVIPNGVDEELFSPRPAASGIRERYGLGKRFVCSYIGTIGMACGLEVVLKTARLLRKRGREDIVFLLVGDGAVREELEIEAEEAGLDNIIFTGKVKREEVPGLLAASNVVLVHLRPAELFSTVMPSKIFEAAGMARPIICGVPGQAGALVEAAGAGTIIHPGREGELCQALLQLADNPVEAEEMGRRGYENIALKFRRTDLAKKYLALLLTTKDNPAK